MTDIVLNKENIKKYLLINEPYLFVDEVKIFDKKNKIYCNMSINFI